MQNREIYESALCLLAESTVAEENADYETRAPYLLAAFCTESEELDAKLRAAAKMPSAPTLEAVLLPLDEAFPMMPRLSTAAALYLAAMLILDSDEERSDKLYAQYADIVSRLNDSLPASKHPITNKYF